MTPSEPDLAALDDDIRTYTEQVRSMLMERFGSWAPDDPIMVALNTIEDAAANPRPDVGLRTAAQAVVREYDTSDDAHVHGSIDALRAALAANPDGGWHCAGCDGHDIDGAQR